MRPETPLNGSVKRFFSIEIQFKNWLFIDFCDFFRGNFNFNDVPATHQGHVLGVPRELAVKDEVNPGVIHLPGILK